MRIQNYLTGIPGAPFKPVGAAVLTKSPVIAQAMTVLTLLLAFQIRGVCAEEFSLETDSLIWRGQTVGTLRPARIQDKPNKKVLELNGENFQLILGDGTLLKASDFKPIGVPEMRKLKAEPDSPNAARHFSGREWITRSSVPEQGLTAEWSAFVREGANYVREQLKLSATNKDVLIKEIVLFEQKVPDATTVGTVDGSPVVAGNFFLGYEHPMARNTVSTNQVVRCSFERNAVLRDGESLTQSLVIGVVPEGQLRRGFLAYVERERAHPYRAFLHYNTWYDIAWDDRKFDEAQSLDAISQFGRELVKQRKVKMDSFLFDDGWDDNQTLWNFHKGFPNGFTPLENAARLLHADIGVWLSPFGGYGDARNQRMEAACQFGFETNSSGFSLAGPKYNQRFREICMEMVQKYGVNQFKFDGLAAGGKTEAGGLTRDGDAMLNLIADLRQARPDIYINQTTGTWPSPFWLLYVDSTWRGGSDHSFAGKGSSRQQWITYRDSQTYRNVVQRGPLYPLNSLMLHGILYATNANRLSETTDQDFADEVHTFFGNGTQLQELYLTPRLLNATNWDDLAEAARWSRANSDVLVDTHWIGGDPAKGEIYGWASWSQRKAILTLRNPDETAAHLKADIADLLQLPVRKGQVFRFKSPWKAEHKTAEVKVGEPYSFSLAPFEVLVLETR